MHKLFIAALIFSLSAPAQAQKAFSSVEERMTGREFTDTGLHKLSDAELNALNEWLRSHSVATMENATVQPMGQSGGQGGEQTGDRRGFENQSRKEMDRSTIVARIDGPFNGWDGEAIFRLDNGMIWKQVEEDSFFVKEIDRPQITIEPGAFGTWRMSVEGYGSDLRVERIQ